MRAPRRGPLEPEVFAALQILKAAGRRPFEDMTIDEARAVYREGRTSLQLPGSPVDEVFDHKLGPGCRISARSYLPLARSSKPAAAILFFHGGGGVVGDLDTHDSICRRLAVASARIVVAVDYRLGPENRFPAAVDDALSAYKTLVAQAPGLGIDPNNIAIAGDSAGGALAVVTAIAAGAARLPAPEALVLFYPVLDLRGGTPSYSEVDGVPTTSRTMKWFCNHYLSRQTDAGDWRASPILATDLAGLPPTIVTSAGHDPLCDEAFAFVQSLRAAGVRCVHRHLPGQIHGFLTLSRLVGEAQRSIEASALFLRTNSIGADLGES